MYLYGCYSLILENLDFIFTSGREELTLQERGVFLLETLKTLEAKDVPAALINRIVLAANYSNWNLTRWSPAISKVECEVMAWLRGGEPEWLRVLHAQAGASG